MRITCVCLNLWNGGTLLENIRSFILDIKPEILCCQEVYNGTDTKLPKQYRSVSIIQALGNYAHVQFDPCFSENIQGTSIDQGNAIFSSLPLEKYDAVFFDEPYTVRPENDPKYYEHTPRNIQHAGLTIGGEKLHVFNTQGIWGKDGEDNDRRLAMAKTIQKTTNGYEPLILTGDFNVREYTRTIQLLEEQFVNVFKGELTTTFNMRQKTNPALASAVIDMIFTSSDLKVSAHCTLPEDVSDHIPLSITVEV